MGDSAYISHMRRLTFIAAPLILLLVAYLLGPKPAAPRWDLSPGKVPVNRDSLDKYVRDVEARHRLKPNNEARIIWFDSARQKTPYSVVYIHGFSASQEEGEPVHRDFAKKFGCNLYLARMADHGVDTVDQLVNFTADRVWATAKEALAIGKALGNKVILMGTSNGATLNLLLASNFPDDVGALINFSPNIEINDPNAWILNNPWGLQVARLVLGGKSRSFPPDSLRDVYWNNPYRLESVVQLEEMLESSMNPSTFSKVKCPVLDLYYYKSEEEQDPVVRVSAILKMHDLLGTPDDQKVAAAVPGAGGHVLASHVLSKDLPKVEEEVNAFAMKILHMQPAQP